MQEEKPEGGIQGVVADVTTTSRVTSPALAPNAVRRQSENDRATARAEERKKRPPGDAETCLAGVLARDVCIFTRSACASFHPSSGRPEKIKPPPKYHKLLWNCKKNRREMKKTRSTGVRARRGSCRPGVIHEKRSPQRQKCNAQDFGRRHPPTAGANERPLAVSMILGT